MSELRHKVLTNFHTLQISQSSYDKTAQILDWHGIGISLFKLFVEQNLKGEIMTTLRFDPFRGFETVIKKFNEIASDLEKGVVVEKGSFAPRVDIYEDEANLYIYAEVAGIKKENISIKINDERMLVLSGSKEREAIEDGRNYVRTERRFGEFSRSFVLPDNVDLEKIKANYNNGVLEITISKKAPEPPKEVVISIN